MPWLIVLLGLGMVVSSVVGIFEKSSYLSANHHVFPVSDPGYGRKCWNPVLAVTIRVLMDETLTGRQKAELVLKEMRIGLCNGGLLGILSLY